MSKIKSRLFYFLAILCLTGYGQKIIYAQNSGFVKTYVFEERKTFFYAIREIDGELLMTGQLKGSATNGKWGVFLARLDTMGNIIKLLIFQDPEDGGHMIYPPLLSEPIYVSGDGTSILCGAMAGLEESFVMRIDSSMTEVDFYRYQHENILDRYAFNCIVHDSAIYSVGNQGNLIGFDAFIQKIDFNGNIIWERSYGLSTGYDNFITILSHQNELYILGTSRESNTTDASEMESRTVIMKVDTSGNIISNFKSNINEEGVSAEELIIAENKYYYITHPFVVDDVGNIHNYPQIVCRDLDFNLIWRKEYGEPYFRNVINDIVFGPDGFIYAAGYIPVDGITWGRACKIDPEDGELIWEARDTAFVIPGWGSRNRMEGLTALPSGSLIVVGYTMDPTFRENGLLYKVTADGCIDTLCTTVSIEDLLSNPDERVVVYPNPASEMIRFDLPESEEAYIVDVYSLDGILLQHETLSQTKNAIYLDHSDYNQGLYIWQVKSNAGKIVDTGKVMIVDK